MGACPAKSDLQCLVKAFESRIRWTRKGAKYFGIRDPTWVEMNLEEVVRTFAYILMSSPIMLLTLLA